MGQLLRHHGWLIAICGLIFFTNLGQTVLWDIDEPRNAVCGREMLERGDWIVPTFNGELRTHKPALLYWLMISSYKVFGVNELGARFGSALMAVGTVLCTYHIGRLMFSRLVGLIAGTALSSSLMFAVAARAATPDSVLIFFTTLAMTFYVAGMTRVRNDESTVGNSLTGLHPTGLQWYLMMYAAMGFAVLAKGPIGFLLPCCIIGLFQLLTGLASERSDTTGETVSKDAETPWSLRSIPFGNLARQTLRFFSPRRWAAVIWSMRPVTAVLVVSAIAAPWYVAVAMQTDGVWVQEFLGGHNVDRFLNPMEKHRGPFFYYLIAVMVGFFPWSCFLPVSLLKSSQRAWRSAFKNPAHVFLLCWAIVLIGFFSLAATKLPNYITPGYPALAVITGWFLGEYALSASREWTRWFHWGVASLAVVGAGILIGFPIAAMFLLDDEAMIGLIGLIPLLGAGLAGWWSYSKEPRMAVATVSISAVLLAAAVFGWASVRISVYQDGPRLAGAARDLVDESTPLAAFRYLPPTMLFYTDRPIESLPEFADVDQFAAEHPQGVLIIRKEDLPELQEMMPDSVVLARCRKFLKPQEVLLLRPVGPPDVEQTALAPVSTVVR